MTVKKHQIKCKKLKLKPIVTKKHIIALKHKKTVYVMRLKNIEMGIFMLTSSLIWQWLKEYPFLFCFVCCFVLSYKMMVILHVYFISKRRDMNIGPFVLSLSLLQTIHSPQTWFGISRQTKSMYIDRPL